MGEPMTKIMTDKELQAGADFYGIDLEEARRRNRVMVDHNGNPRDPICVGCAKRPHEIEGYRIATMTDPDDKPTDEQIKQYVLEEEGTLNTRNGHFLCDKCYIKNGQPSRSFPDRWVCP